jgi:hypothetical protein
VLSAAGHEICAPGVQCQYFGPCHPLRITLRMTKLPLPVRTAAAPARDKVRSGQHTTPTILNQRKRQDRTRLTHSALMPIVTACNPISKVPHSRSWHRRDAKHECGIICRLYTSCSPFKGRDKSNNRQSGQWAILPKKFSVETYISIALNQLESKVVQVCLGLIKCLAYLHEHCIARSRGHQAQ